MGQQCGSCVDHHTKDMHLRQHASKMKLRRQKDKNRKNMDKDHKQNHHKHGDINRRVLKWHIIGAERNNMCNTSKLYLPTTPSSVLLNVDLDTIHEKRNDNELFTKSL